MIYEALIDFARTAAGGDICGLEFNDFDFVYSPPIPCVPIDPIILSALEFR